MGCAAVSGALCDLISSPLPEAEGSGLAGAEWEGGFLKEGCVCVRVCECACVCAQPQGTHRLENREVSHIPEVGEEL